MPEQSQFSAFAEERLAEATEKYLRLEEEISKSEGGRQAVLVYTDSVDALKRAYPNYFLDTHEFLKILQKHRTNFLKSPYKALFE